MGEEQRGGRGAERRPLASGASCPGLRPRRDLAAVVADRHLPPARVSALGLGALSPRHRAAAVGATLRGHPSRRPATSRSCSWLLPLPRTRSSGCWPLLWRAWRTSRSRFSRRRTAASRPLPCACRRTQARGLDLLREGDAPLRRGDLPRRPRPSCDRWPAACRSSPAPPRATWPRTRLACAGQAWACRCRGASSQRGPPGGAKAAVRPGLRGRARRLGEWADRNDGAAVAADTLERRLTI